MSAGTRRLLGTWRVRPTRRLPCDMMMRSKFRQYSVDRQARRRAIAHTNRISRCGPNRPVAPTSQWKTRAWVAPGGSLNTRSVSTSVQLGRWKNATSFISGAIDGLQCDFQRPRCRRRIGQHVLNAKVWSLLGQTRRATQQRIGIGLDVPGMSRWCTLLGRRSAHRCDLVERALQRRIERDGRVQHQRAVSEADDSHRAPMSPTISGSGRCALRSGASCSRTCDAFCGPLGVDATQEPPTSYFDVATETSSANSAAEGAGATCAVR